MKKIKGSNGTLFSSKTSGYCRILDCCERLVIRCSCSISIVDCPGDGWTLDTSQEALSPSLATALVICDCSFRLLGGVCRSRAEKAENRAAVFCGNPLVSVETVPGVAFPKAWYSEVYASSTSLAR